MPSYAAWYLVQTCLFIIALVNVGTQAVAFGDIQMISSVSLHIQQKYKLRLREFGLPKQIELLRLCSGVAAKTGQWESSNFSALCAPYQMPAQTLASLEQEMLGQPSGSVPVPPMGHLNLQHASMQSQPLMDCQTNMCNISPHWKLCLSARIIQAEGFKRVFRQFFSAKKGEKLLNAFHYLLSTTFGPIARLFFISTDKITFHCDQPITLTSPNGELARVPYKVLISLRMVKGTISSENGNKPNQKYIQIITLDDFEFWFMGFVSFQKSFTNLRKAISESQ